MKEIKDQREVWDNIAPSWDTHRRDVWISVVNFLNEASGKILDLGCGSGRNFVKNDNQELYAVDFSPKMIELAKVNADFKGIEDAQFFTSRSNNLPFSNDYFDAVLCWSMLHCLETQEKRRGTLEAIYRVLKPGGKVLLSTWSRGSKRIKNRDKETFVSWTTDSINEKRYTYVYDIEELEKELREIGFVIEKIYEDNNIVAILTKN